MSFLQLASTIAYNHTNASTSRSFVNSIAGETGQLLQTKGLHDEASIGSPILLG